MTTLSFVPLSEIQRIRKDVIDPVLSTKILADVFRLNALSMIMETGSGHIGSSLSCPDILTWLWLHEMVDPNGSDPDGDIFFSSKGHDVPALYSVLIGMEKLPFDSVHTLRRFNGLPGHPDIHTPFIATNTGSLGMGISKARGMALAKRLDGRKGRMIVLTGDGELEEGQIWESLQQTANGKFSEIVVIVDHNKIQSDTWVTKVSNLGDLERKFAAFGWDVARCDGHDVSALKQALDRFKTVTDKPHILIADTVKGKGVSDMEKMLQDGDDQFYKFHSGAPAPEVYEKGIRELTSRIDSLLQEAGQQAVACETMEMPAKAVAGETQKLLAAYGDELAKIGDERKDTVVLDADLMVDCGLLPFRKKYPERFFECGIAEQDMVSMAGGLALSGKLPIIHSFACFLSTRPNEQIYNNATEGKKIIYTASLAGLLPATPGHSHQSVRDISALGSNPGLTMIEPCNEQETRMVLRWAVETNLGSTYIRLVNLPCEIPYQLQDDHELTVGRGSLIAEGKDAILFAYGPVMLSQAFKAAEILKAQGITMSVCNLPWLNSIDEEWLKETASRYAHVFTLDDHYVKLGQGEQILAALSRLGFKGKAVSFGLDEIPACGRAGEVLAHHGLDAASLAERVSSAIRL